MGDIADGAAGVLVFFGVAFVVTAILLYWYSGSLMLTSYAIVCAVVPVIWLLGLLPLLGLALDPMSILVPFLIFSIAVSHAVQMTNGWKLETLAGHDGISASRLCFEKLFVPGAIALLANALGFLVACRIGAGRERDNQHDTQDAGEEERCGHGSLSQTCSGGSTGSRVVVTSVSVRRTRNLLRLSTQPSPFTVSNT